MTPDQLQREALRLYERYQLEVVEGWNLCPWAARARLAGKVTVRVVLEAEPNQAALHALLDELAADSHVEIGILLFPRLESTPRSFEGFVGRLREDDAARRPLGTLPFMFAAFHPDAILDATDAERLVPFLRRTPDPTIQLVRSSAIEAVRRGSPQGTRLVDIEVFDYKLEPPTLALRERIAQANLATVERMGLDALQRTLDDIRRDRDETYGTAPT